MAAAEVEEQILEEASRAGVFGVVKGEGSLELRHPGLPAPVSRSIASRSSSFRNSASATAFLTGPSGAIEAKSTRVRATGVTGRPLWSTRSTRFGIWTCTSLSDWRRLGLETWVMVGIEGMRLHHDVALA
jgi:hypothetical protein